ncbi:uncharacterized protein STEHIDRAFT_162639 [Stereum hirsutum FP-91666 SS1]|uniref:uncharacterized protein n=1 Tax=Stereum hirsutum (strain FP-91666) TaxID=721885 RepID=UPI0004449F09|nr:uncharacterized protein STEHIDRAFT_162639 [Stereum hirsutum FP-91666 SS1]EIM80877.1 hypothetical protein STEHIDRAFT_162639 [Stereum hirsutum FP-91666 SS1]
MLKLSSSIIMTSVVLCLSVLYVSEVGAKAISVESRGVSFIKREGFDSLFPTADTAGLETAPDLKKTGEARDIAARDAFSILDPTANTTDLKPQEDNDA